MTKKHSMKTAVSVTALMVGAFVFTGCAGSNESVSSADGSGSGSDVIVYEFAENGTAPAKKLQIQLPEDLIVAAGDKGKEVKISSFTATARTLPGVEYCAIDLGINYVEGGAEALAPNGESELAVENFEGSVFGMGTGRASLEPMADFDEADASPGAFLADDLKSAVVVQFCAESPLDADEEDGEYYFAALNESSALAAFSLSVMKDGTLGIPEHKVGGFVRDTNGDWIAD